MDMDAACAPSFHAAMYPWYAVGHLTPFLHLANKLANKGNRISFLIPTNTQFKLQPFNLYPDLIDFVPITVPHVYGLPPGAETTSDVPSHLVHLLKTAMDRTQDDIVNLLDSLGVQFVFFDFAHWIPAAAQRLGIKSIYYSVITPAVISYAANHGREATRDELMQPPPGYPFQAINLFAHEVPALYDVHTMKFGSDLSILDLVNTGIGESDVACFRACREIEEPFCDFIESLYKKPILVSGPVIPDTLTSGLDEKWAQWLGGFKAGSVIYCALGTETILEKHQFQELVLGLELTGMPFLAALKIPSEAKSLEEALPENFERRIGRGGVVHGGWVQQQLILGHRSIGCFVTHCGSNSLWEGLLSQCQLVLLPHISDQVINARFLSRELKVGVEVEKGKEDGLFTRDSVCKAVKIVMAHGSETAKELKTNHDKLRELVLSSDLGSSYIKRLDEQLKRLLM